MTVPAPFPVPPGQYPPFAVVTDTDHAAWIIVTTALGLAMILLFSVVKIFIRYAVSPRVGLDEVFLTISTVRKPLCPRRNEN